MMRPIAEILTNFRDVAFAHGYALGEHGSKVRDFDLIAVPWTDNAATVAELHEAFSRIPGISAEDEVRENPPGPHLRPHGREGFIYMLNGWRPGPEPYYFDVSVFPPGYAVAVEALREVARLEEETDDLDTITRSYGIGREAAEDALRELGVKP